jgi:hypothetical protein
MIGYSRGHNRPIIYEMKSLTSIHPSPLKPAKQNEYIIEWTSGNSLALMNFKPGSVSCKSEKYVPASSVHAKLLGNALNFKCESFSEGTLSSKQKFVFLQQYGIFVLMENTTASSTLTRTISDVEFSKHQEAR